MRRLSKINESLFKKVIDRSDEKETRIENESDIERGYRIMCKLDTVSISGIEWVPFPFGSSKSDVPGLFLNYNEILELKEFLKGKGYRIASQDDFETLATYKNKTVKVSGCSTEYNGKTVRGFSFDNKLKFFYFGAILSSGESSAEDKSAMFVTDIDENSKSVDVNTIVGDFKTNYVSMFPMSFKHYGTGYQVMIIKDDKVTESVFKKAIDRSDEKETRTEDSLDIRFDDFVSRHGRMLDDFYIQYNKVQCNYSVYIYEDDLINGKLPFSFGDVDFDFAIENCSITSLEGCPEKVKGYFSCNRCKELKTLDGAPKKVKGNFYCQNCKGLITLEGGPQEVGDSYNCYGCAELTSLKGSPNKVGGNFNCTNCEKLTSLEGCPQKVGRSFSCQFCGKKFGESDIPEGTIIKGIFNY